ncbi:MAG TPA: hypothetical protein VGY51_10505 [Acidimicrobiales bacterium]|jgi:hypothetical protein|nr:hypothetical protein [Acidimicrobiales bacterium]
MTTDGRGESQSLQPQLPLTEASPRSERTARKEPAQGAPTSTRSRRLNEQTRRIGRQGVAAARAQLEGTATATRQDHPEGDPRPTGRAA